MLLNERSDVRQIISTIGKQKGVKKIRIYNKIGEIVISSDSSELMKKVNLDNEACIGCHTKAGIVAPEDSIRIFSTPGSDERVLGLINPIRNETDCYNAECHFHKSTDQVLGVLDVMISMNQADQTISKNEKSTIINSILITIIIAAISGFFIFFVVNKPLKSLSVGINEVGKENWDYRIEMRTKSELGAIAKQFNDMSRKLSSAYSEIMEWSNTLNEKVEQKTEELKNIYQQVIQFEKLASVGKLSASVAHELNNPLAGILTYSRLIEKKLKESDQKDDFEKLIKYINLIAEESDRCGKIVKDLLLFSHRSEEEFVNSDLTDIIDKSEMLIKHHFEINKVNLVKEFSNNISLICNPQKIQQCFISLFINAIESMSGSGGTINLSAEKQNGIITIKVNDTGCGISDKDLPHIFEPFYSTKEAAKGTGLGLSIVYGIIKSHDGSIEVENTSSAGTTFKITLPDKLNLN
jgi:two-component system NtrC family sensor kinase